MIAIVDYNIGNLAAVANMLSRIGAANRITASAADIADADQIILPGNGSFDACMRNLRASGLLHVLEKKVLREHTPLLGICVGAQMLGIASAEGVEPGLGWIDMRVRRFPSMPALKVPHMGWSEVRSARPKHPLGQVLAADARFYFVHSYYMEPSDPDEVLFEASYGIEFAAAVSRANITGVQFHPEKSHRFGKQLLTAFARAS
jgi:imidazole glycerol-phosphate synthase subunit HisH